MSAAPRPRIFPCPLPWTISASGSFLKLVVEEESAGAGVDAAVNRLDDAADELRPAFVRLSFEQGLLTATHGLGKTGHFEPGEHFDASAVAAVWAARGEEPLLARWRRLGVCDSSGVYEVTGSQWDGEPLAAPWRRFVLQGTELWMEVVARACRWIWVDANGQPLGGGGEIAPPAEARS